MSKKTPDKPSKPKSSKKKSIKKEVQSFGYSQSPRYFMLQERAAKCADALEIDIDTIQHIYLPGGSEIIGQCIPATDDFELLEADDVEKAPKSKKKTKSSKKDTIYVLNPFQLVSDEYEGMIYLLEFNSHTAFPIIEINTSRLAVKPSIVSVETIERYLSALEHQFDLTPILTMESDLVAIDEKKQVEKESKSGSNVIDFSKYLKNKPK